MRSALTCRKPDRDVPKMVCGYPLPCPFHTVLVDVSAKPAKVVVPKTVRAGAELGRVRQIAVALGDVVLTRRRRGTR